MAFVASRYGLDWAQYVPEAYLLAAALPSVSFALLLDLRFLAALPLAVLGILVAEWCDTRMVFIDTRVEIGLIWLAVLNSVILALL